MDRELIAKLRSQAETWLIFPSGHRCRIFFDPAPLPNLGADDELDIARKLGASPDRPLVRHSFTTDPDCRTHGGYRVETIYADAPHATVYERVRPASATAGPYGEQILVVTPKDGPRWAAHIGGLIGTDGKIANQAEVRRVHRGLAVLRAISNRAGRPSGSKDREKYPTRESYVAAIHNLYKRVDRNRWPLHDWTEAIIAQKLLISVNTLRSRNKEHAVTCDDIKARRV